MDIMNIMVVDDEDDQRMLLQLLLREWGYDVQAAANGKESIERAGEQCPDVVLMDLNMPVMNGFEATRRLRAMPEMARAHIIAVSGYLHDNQEWCDRAFAAGCDKCLGKPVDLTVLRTALAGVNGARPFRAAGGPRVPEALDARRGAADRRARHSSRRSRPDDEPPAMVPKVAC